MKPFFQHIKKPLSLWLALCFMLTQAGSLIPQAAAFSSAEIPISTPAFELVIPADLGTVQAISSGPGPTIVHLQTAHGNYQAQKKIQALLHFLKDRYGFEELFLEGSPYELEPRFIRFFPTDTALTRTVADGLARKALLKGAELFLMEEKAARGHGIEDLQAYKRNVDDFRAVLLQKRKAKKFLAAMDVQIDRLSSPYLNKNLHHFLKRLEAMQSAPLPLQEWLMELKENAGQSLEFDFTDPALQIDWPMLLRYFKLREIEQRLDPQAYLREKENFLTAIGPIPMDLKTSLQRLLASTLSDQELPDPETGLLFENLIAHLPPDFLFQDFPQTCLFITHLILRSELKGDRLIQEMTVLEDTLSTVLAQNEVERNLVLLYKDYRLLKKLFALELTPEDYKNLLARKQAVRPSQVAARFLDVNHEKRVRNSEFKYTKSLDRLFQRALAFYTDVQVRDGRMLLKLERQLQTSGIRKAVVITGGFHAQPFRDHFHERGYNYALIAPKITETGGKEKYEESMLQSQLPKSTLESIFQALPARKVRAAGFDPRPFKAALAAETKQARNWTSAAQLQTMLESSPQFQQARQRPSKTAAVRSEVRAKASVEIGETAKSLAARGAFEAQANATVIQGSIFTNILQLLQEQMPDFEKNKAFKNLSRRVPTTEISKGVGAHLRGSVKTLTMPLILQTLRDKIAAGRVIQLAVPDPVYRSYIASPTDIDKLAWVGKNGQFYFSSRFFQYLKDLGRHNPKQVQKVVAALLVRLAVFDLLASQLPDGVVYSAGLHHAVEKFSVMFEQAVAGGSILDPRKSSAADAARLFVYQERFSEIPLPERVMRSVRTGVSTAENLMVSFQASLREDVVLPYYENRQIYQSRGSESAVMKVKREQFIREFVSLRRRYRAEILMKDGTEEASTARLSYLSERVLWGIERLGPRALQSRITRYQKRYEEISKRIARYYGDETKQDRLIRLNEAARDILSRLIYLEMQPSRIDHLMRNEKLWPGSDSYKTLDARFRQLRYSMRSYERELLWLRVREAGRREVTAYVVDADWQKGVGSFLLSPEFFAREFDGEVVYPKFLPKAVGQAQAAVYKDVADQVSRLAKGAVKREMIRYRRQKIYLQDSTEKLLQPYWDEFEGFKEYMVERLRSEGTLAKTQAVAVTLAQAVDTLIRGPLHDQGLTAGLLDDFQQFLNDQTEQESVRDVIENHFQRLSVPDIDAVGAVIAGTEYKSIFDLLRSYNHTLFSYAQANLTAFEMVGLIDDAANRLRALTRHEFAHLPNSEALEEAARADIDADLRRVRQWSGRGIKPSRRIVGDELSAALLAVQFQDLDLLRKSVTLARADTQVYIRENERISKFIALKAMGMRDFIRKPVQVLLKSEQLSTAAAELETLRKKHLPPRFKDPGYQRARKRLRQVQNTLETMDGRTLLNKKGAAADQLREKYVRQLIELELIIYDVIHKHTSDEDYENLLPVLRAEIEPLLLGSRRLDETMVTPDVLRELHVRVLGKKSVKARRSEMRTGSEQDKGFQALVETVKAYASSAALSPAAVAAQLVSTFSNGRPQRSQKRTYQIVPDSGYLPEAFRQGLTGDVFQPPEEPLHLTQEQLGQPAYRTRETNAEGAVQDFNVMLDGLLRYGQPAYDLLPFYDANTNSYGYEIHGQDGTPYGALILRRQGRVLKKPVHWQPKLTSTQGVEEDESEGDAAPQKKLGRSSSPVTFRAQIFEKLTALVFNAVSGGQAVYHAGFALDPLISRNVFPDLDWAGVIYDAKLGADLNDIGKTLIKYSQLKEVHPDYFKADSPLTIVVLDKTATQNFNLQGYVKGVDFRFVSLEEFMAEHQLQREDYQDYLNALYRKSENISELTEILGLLDQEMAESSIPGGQVLEHENVRRRLSSDQLKAMLKTEPNQLLAWVLETQARVALHYRRPQYLNEHYALLTEQLAALHEALPTRDWIAAHLAEHEQVYAELSDKINSLEAQLQRILPQSIYTFDHGKSSGPVGRSTSSAVVEKPGILALPDGKQLPAADLVPAANPAAPAVVSDILENPPRTGPVLDRAAVRFDEGSPPDLEPAEGSRIMEPLQAGVTAVQPMTAVTDAAAVTTGTFFEHLRDGLGESDPLLEKLSAELDVLSQPEFPGFEALDTLIFSPDSRMRKLYEEVQQPQPLPWWDVAASEKRVLEFLAGDFSGMNKAAIRDSTLDLLRAAPNPVLESKILTIIFNSKRAQGDLPINVQESLDSMLELVDFEKSQRAHLSTLSANKNQISFLLNSLSYEVIVRHSPTDWVRDAARVVAHTSSNKVMALQSSYGHPEWLFVQKESFFWEAFLANLVLDKPELSKTILRFLKVRRQTAGFRAETPQAISDGKIAVMELLLGERQPKEGETEFVESWENLLESLKTATAQSMTRLLERIETSSSETQSWDADKFARELMADLPASDLGFMALNETLGQGLGDSFQVQAGGSFLLLWKTGFFFEVLRRAQKLTSDDNILGLLSSYAGTVFRPEELMLTQYYSDEAAAEASSGLISYPDTARMHGFLKLLLLEVTNPEEMKRLTKMLGSARGLFPKNKRGIVSWSRFVSGIFVGQMTSMDETQRQLGENFLIQVEEGLWSEDADLARAAAEILHQIFLRGLLEQNTQVKAYAAGLAQRLWGDLFEHVILYPEKRYRVLSASWPASQMDETGRAAVLARAQFLLEDGVSFTDIHGALRVLRGALVDSLEKEKFDAQVLVPMRELDKEVKVFMETMIQRRLQRDQNFTELEETLKLLRDSGYENGNWQKKLLTLAGRTPDLLDRLLLESLAAMGDPFAENGMRLIDELLAAPWDDSIADRLLQYGKETPDLVPYILRSLRRVEDGLPTKNKAKLKKGLVSRLPKTTVRATEDREALALEIEDLLGHGLDFSGLSKAPAVKTIMLSKMDPLQALDHLQGLLAKRPSDRLLLRVEASDSPALRDWEALGFSPLVDLQDVLRQKLQTNKGYTVELSADNLKLIVRFEKALLLEGVDNSISEWIFVSPSHQKIDDLFNKPSSSSRGWKGEKKPMLLEPAAVSGKLSASWQKGELIPGSTPRIPYGLADQRAFVIFTRESGLNTAAIISEDKTAEVRRHLVEAQVQRTAGIRSRIKKRLIREFTPDWTVAKELLLVRLERLSDDAAQVDQQLNPAQMKALQDAIESFRVRDVIDDRLFGRTEPDAANPSLQTLRFTARQRFEAALQKFFRTLENLPLEARLSVDKVMAELNLTHLFSIENLMMLHHAFHKTAFDAVPYQSPSEDSDAAALIAGAYFSQPLKLSSWDAQVLRNGLSAVKDSELSPQASSLAAKIQSEGDLSYGDLLDFRNKLKSRMAQMPRGLDYEIVFTRLLPAMEALLPPRLRVATGKASEGKEPLVVIGKLDSPDRSAGPGYFAGPTRGFFLRISEPRTDRFQLSHAIFPFDMPPSESGLYLVLPESADTHTDRAQLKTLVKRGVITPVHPGLMRTLDWLKKPTTVAAQIAAEIYDLDPSLTSHAFLDSLSGRLSPGEAQGNPVLQVFQKYHLAVLSQIVPNAMPEIKQYYKFLAKIGRQYFEMSKGNAAVQDPLRELTEASGSRIPSSEPEPHAEVVSLNKLEAARLLDAYRQQTFHVDGELLAAVAANFGAMSRLVKEHYYEAAESTDFSSHEAEFSALMTRLQSSSEPASYQDVMELSRLRGELDADSKEMVGRDPLVLDIITPFREVLSDFHASVAELHVKYGFKFKLIDLPHSLKRDDSLNIMAGFYDNQGRLFVATHQNGIFQALGQPGATMDLSSHFGNDDSRMGNLLADFPNIAQVILIPVARFYEAEPRDVYLYRQTELPENDYSFNSRLDPALGAEIGPGVFVLFHEVMEAFNHSRPGIEDVEKFSPESFNKFKRLLSESAPSVYATMDKSQGARMNLNASLGKPASSIVLDQSMIDTGSFDIILNRAWVPAFNDLAPQQSEALYDSLVHLVAVQEDQPYLDPDELWRQAVEPRDQQRLEPLRQKFIKRVEGWRRVMEANYVQHFGSPGFTSRINPALGDEIGPGILLFRPEVLTAITKVLGLSEGGRTGSLGPLTEAQYQELVAQLQPFAFIYDELDSSQQGLDELNKALSENSPVIVRNPELLAEPAHISQSTAIHSHMAAFNALPAKAYDLMVNDGAGISLELKVALMSGQTANLTRPQEVSEEDWEKILSIFPHFSRVMSRFGPVIQENFLNAMARRSEMRRGAALTPEIRTTFRIFRSEVLPLRFETYGSRELVRILRQLLNRAVFSEKADIQPERTESTLKVRFGSGALRATPAGQDWFKQMPVEGRVLLDDVWIKKLIRKSPRTLYLLFAALDKFQSEHALTEPLIAVSGETSLWEEILRSLQRSGNGLSAEEKAEARPFMNQKRLRQLMRILPPAGISQYLRDQNYGVATLSALDDSWLAELPLGAQFLLDPAQVAEEDLMALAFLIPSLLRVAQQVRGIEGAAAQKAELIRKLQEIVWGAFPRAEGRGFTIQISAFIENVLVQQRLVDLSA